MIIWNNSSKEEEHQGKEEQRINSGNTGGDGSAIWGKMDWKSAWAVWWTKFKLAQYVISVYVMKMLKGLEEKVGIEVEGTWCGGLLYADD